MPMQEQPVTSMQEHEEVPVIVEAVNEQALTFDQLEFEDMIESNEVSKEPIIRAKNDSICS